MRTHQSWRCAALALLVFPLSALAAEPAESTKAPAEAVPIVQHEKRTLADATLPAPKNGGLTMDGYILWCPSVIKVGDTYHLFASRWPGEYGMGGWTKYSECIRATAKELTGPYTFQEVVLQKRPDNWDNTRVHNVKIVRARGKFVLFYIDTANETGYATANAVTGPWTRIDAPVMKISNPAILVRSDQSVYVFGRLGDSNKVNRGIAYTAPSYAGPYTLVQNGDNLLPNGGELEDPTIWWANHQYNIVVNDWKGHATGTSKAGAQYFSKDGIHYELMTSTPVFTKMVKYTDGTEERFSRRERPFVYTNEKGEVVALLSACLRTEHQAVITVVPIDHYVPGNKLP